MSHLSQYPAHAAALEALETGRGRGIKVAVIDSGVELSHPMLRGLRLIDDIAFSPGPKGAARPSSGRGIDVHGHGTAVAWLVREAAPEAQLGSFRVFDSGLSSRFSLIEAAALLAIERGYNILNCSFGTIAKIESLERFKSWVDQAYRRGAHVVCPCNNFFFREPEWPGSFPTVITVNMAATAEGDLFFRPDPEGEGRRGHLVEFAARGVDLEVPWKNGTVVRKTGSSFAAARASGMLARFLSRHPGVKPPVAKSLLQEIASPWHDGLAASND